MSYLIQKITKLAHQTFSKRNKEESIQKLRNLMSQLNAKDVDFKPDLIERNSKLRAPVAYIHLLENHLYSIGIFAIKEGKNIPLHNHPDMYGLIKVIKGKISVKSYTQMPSNQSYTVPQEIFSQVSSEKLHLLLPTLMGEEKVVNCDDNITCLVSPHENNIHEVTSVEGLSAFLDILAPPYSFGERDCQFYSILGTCFDSKLKLNITWLLETDTPKSYWCDSLQYTGPPI
jgi:PREDICTED: similar to chromosome 10 open reading frame 22